jgi:hypothetical protein
VSGSGPLTGAGLATAVALLAARKDSCVSREAVLEGCDPAEVLAATEEIAWVLLSRLPLEEREAQLQFFGLVAAANVAAAAGEG